MCQGWTESQERMAVKACRVNKVMMGRLVFLAKPAHVVKLVSQDSQEIRGASDRRVSGVFEVKADLLAKRASGVAWDSQDHKETKGLKGNLVIQGNQDFQEFWEFLDQGGLQETLGQRAYGDQRGRKAQWAKEELSAPWELSAPVEVWVLEERKAIVERQVCKDQGDLLDLVDLLDFPVARVSPYHLGKMVFC